MPAVVAAVVLAACSSGGTDDDPAAALAERVQAVLATPSGGASVVDRVAQFGVDVAADDLAAATPLCPRVEDPEAGDEATCRVTVGDHELEIDVAFEADGSIQVVDAEVAP